VFAKPPEPGRVKTRLIPAVGATRAAELAAAFLTDTLNGIARMPWAKPVLATTGDHADPVIFGDRVWAHCALEPHSVQVWLQGEGDLGERLERIAIQALHSHSAMIALGADSPDLPANRLHAANEALTTHDAVLGPTEDGGYYLLGLRRCPAGLLRDLPWSQPNTLQATLERLTGQDYRVALLPPWYDVDEPDDLTRLRKGLNNGSALASRSKAVLDVIPSLDV